MEFDTLKTFLMKDVRDIFPALSVRVHNVILNYGYWEYNSKTDPILFVAQLYVPIDSDWLRQPNFGHKSLKEMKDWMEQQGVPYGSIKYRYEEHIAGITEVDALDKVLTPENVTLLKPVHRPEIITHGADFVKACLPQELTKSLTPEFTKEVLADPDVQRELQDVLTKAVKRKLGL